MPLLVVERGNDKGLTLKVEAEKVYVVGRDNPQSAITLKDPMASRAHFEIRSENGGFVVKDLKSRNGTVLNDEKLAAPAALKIGDKIQVGETIFSFLSDEKEETASGFVGKVIGGYRLIERLGRGGMGTVYKAEQLSLKRQVALKVLSSKLMSDPVFVERFVEEAKAAGQLNHPNIVQVFDVGSDRGVHFFSMELMEPESVGDVVSKKGPVQWNRALEILTDSARGLIYAEKRGIVHRDIKPDNLMLTAEGTVKIGDLGLAKKAAEVAGEGGVIFGTPHFIAPEQAQGKPVDNRADLYALGASFYRILSGKTPFSGENVKEILVKQVNEEPVPLPKVVADLPPELALVIGKLMKKRPDDRYRSAQGLFEDLERIRIRYHLESHGAVASAKRSKVIAAVLALAVVALGGVTYHFVTRPPTTVERIIDNTKPTDPNANTGPTGPTPAELADKAFNAAKTAYLEMQLKKGGLPAQTWRKSGAEKDWLDIAKRLEKVKEDYPGTEGASDAAKYAADIRGQIATAKADHEARTEKARSEWKALLEEVDGLVAGEEFAKALARLGSGTDDLVRREKEFLEEGAETQAETLRTGVLSAARLRADALVGTATEAAPVFPGATYLGARTSLEEFRGRLGADDPEGPAASLRETLQRVDAALRDTADTALKAAAAALDGDREAYFRTYLQIRRWRPAEDEDLSGAKDTPFFAYRWDEAIALWDGLSRRLATPMFRDRVAAKIAHYRRCKRLFETVVAKLNSGEFRDPGFPDSVTKRATAVLDRSKPATSEGVPILRQGVGREFRFMEFREMTPREYYVDFLREGRDLKFSGEDHLDLAVFLAEAGLGLLSVNEHSAASIAQPPGAYTPELKDWIEGEITAYSAYAGPGGVVDAWKRYAASRADGASLGVQEGHRKSVENLLLDFIRRYYATDFYVLNASLQGPESPVPPLLYPDERRREIVDTLGVPGAKPLPRAADPPGGTGDPVKDGPPVKDPAPEDGAPPRTPGDGAPPLKPGDPKTDGEGDRMALEEEAMEMAK